MAAPVQETISIGSKADTRGFKKAETAAQKLNKQLRNLGLALGTTALVSYGKAAVKAFAEDEAAARRLASAVDNLGLSFSQAKVTDFIANLESSAAIADDVLRPAFQSLLTTTGSLTKSQELLNNAIQISRASGIDLATVATDLGKGYVGITRGLIKYNTGLTRAEITTKSFNEILGVMLARSAGSAQDYLTTTSYKMEVLTVAAGNAQETIGAGLVDAFAKIGGGSTATDAAKTIDTIAKSINAMTSAVGIAVSGLVKLYRAFDYVGSLGGLLGENGSLFSQFEDKPNTNRSKSPAGTAQRTAQQRQAEALAAKRAKELAALQTKQVKAQKALTDEQKKQAALKKAGSIFDLEQIQVIAALKGKLSDEDRKRVELQFALLTGNVSEAKKLTAEIAAAQGLSKDLAGYLASLPDAKNPFAAWGKYLDDLAKKASLIVTGDPNFNSSLGWNNNPSFPEVPEVPTSNVTPFPRSTPGSFRRAEEQSNFTGPIQLSVNIDGKAIASALQDTSLSGVSSSVNRTYGSFAGR
jgi:hypothetical protein